MRHTYAWHALAASGSRAKRVLPGSTPCRLTATFLSLCCNGMLCVCMITAFVSASVRSLQLRSYGFDIKQVTEISLKVWTLADRACRPVFRPTFQSYASEIALLKVGRMLLIIWLQRAFLVSRLRTECTLKGSQLASDTCTSTKAMNQCMASFKNHTNSTVN